MKYTHIQPFNMNIIPVKNIICDLQINIQINFFYLMENDYRQCCVQNLLKNKISFFLMILLGFEIRFYFPYEL